MSTRERDGDQELLIAVAGGGVSGNNGGSKALTPSDSLTPAISHHSGREVCFSIQIFFSQIFRFCSKKNYMYFDFSAYF